MSINIFNVDDFGAKPDSKSDSSGSIAAAITAAIESAKSTGKSSEVRFGPGVYRIDGPDSRLYGIIIKDGKDVTVTGIRNQTKILVVNPMLSGFKVLGGENIAIRNFIIDYDPLPYTQGTITAVDFEAAYFDIDLDEGYIDFTDRMLANPAAAFGLPNRVNGETDSQFGPWAIVAKQYIHLHDRVWRIVAADDGYLKMTGLQVGARFVHKSCVWIDAAVSSSNCKNITAENITVYSSIGSSSLWGNNDKVTIRNLKVTIPEGSGRLLSTNQDSIHGFGNRGGMTIDGCSFYGMADDGINIHGRSAVVKEVIADDKVVVMTGGVTDCHVGDDLMIFNFALGHEKSKVKATEVETSVGGHIQTITFDRKVPGLSAGNDYFDKAGDNLFNLSACSQNTVIKNCSFFSMRGRSILMNTHDILIENNTFYNVEGWAVSLDNDPNWKEGPAAFNITIRNNNFNGVGFGYATSVFIRSMPNPDGGAPFKNIKNVVVENNTFTKLINSAIGTSGVEGLVIRGNKLSNIDESPQKIAGIKIADANGVVISGNKINDLTKQTYAGIHITDSADTGTNGVIMEDDNNIFVGSHTLQIMDDRK
ncbi:MAG: right-handed parallel beta-helix repeat-containing protein [Saccharofermentanales bacterium]